MEASMDGDGAARALGCPSARCGTGGGAGRRGRCGNAGHEIHVTAFTSSGLRALGKRVGLPLAVVAAVRDPSDHLARLVAEEHACWSLEEDWCFGGLGGREIDPLRPDFEPVPFDPRWLGGRRLPDGMAIDRGSLLVTAPGAIDGDAFSDGLKRGLAARRLGTVAALPGRVLGRRASGRPVHVPPRYSRTPGAGWGATAFVLADDVYAFRPRHLPVLVSAATAARERLLAAAWLSGNAS